MKKRKSSSVQKQKSRSANYFVKKSATGKQIQKALVQSRKIQKNVRLKSAKSAKKSRNSSASKFATTSNVSFVKPKAKLSSYFLSSDIIRKDLKSHSNLQPVPVSKQEFEQKVDLARSLNTGLKEKSKKARLSRFEIIKRNIMILVRRFLAWFSSNSHRANITSAGRRALLQLGDLYDLLMLEAIDDESLLKLKVAYGEACYYVTQASRSYLKKHGGKGRENYSAYFDRFVDCASG